MNEVTLNDNEPGQPAGREPRFFYGYVIVAASFVIMLAMFAPRSAYGVYFKPLIAEFGWSRGLISGAFSLSTIVQGLSGIIMGSLSDRFGPRVVMTICGLLIGIGGLLMAWMDAAWQLYLLYGLMIGIGMGSFFVTLLSTVARWFARRRNLMTGLAIAGGGTSGLITPPIINWLISVEGWRNSYLITSAIVLALIVIIAQFLKRDPSSIGLKPYGAGEKPAGETHIPGTEGFSLREAASTWQFRMLTIILFCLGYCMITIMVHIVPHTTDLGIDPANAANLLSITAAMHLVSSITMGSLADKFGLRRVYILCFILLVAAMFLLLVTNEFWMFSIFAAILGLSGGGGTTLMSPLVAELFGIRSHGLILGVCAFSSTIGSATGPYAAGYIFDVVGSYQPAFIICAVLSVIGLALALIIRPPRRWQV